MKNRLIMLGTGNAMVTKCYNTCFAIENEGEYLLVDAGGGNGIFTQLEKTGIGVEKIHKMFVTHAHTDHVLGVIWIIRKVATLMRQDSYEGDFTIYCHDEVADLLNLLCQRMLPNKFLVLVGERIHIEEVKDREGRKACGLELTFFDIASTKAKQFGFRAVLPDGRILSCLGDEPFNEVYRNLVINSDWMLCEAFCLYEDRDRFKPYEKHHSTALDAGKLAQELGIKNLLLYHTEDKTLATRKENYTSEAKQNFTGRVEVPEDLEVITL